MCKFCEKYDFGGVGFDITSFNGNFPTIYFPCRKGEIPTDERFQYCTVCGEKLTEKNFPSIDNE